MNQIQHSSQKQGSSFLAFLLVLFLFSGQFRSLLSAFIGSFSLLITFIPLAILAFAMLLRLYRPFTKDVLPILVMALGLTAFFFMAASYTPSESYYQTKLIQWLVLVFSLCVPIFVRINTKWFVTYFCLGSIVVFLIFIFTQQFELALQLLESDLRNLLRATLYLTAGYYLAAAILLQLFYNKNMWLIVIMLMCLIATGARGPLIFLILSYLTYLLLSGKLFLRIHWILASIVGFILISVGLYFMGYDAIFDRFIARFSVMFDTGGGASISARFHYIAQSFKFIEESPWIGHGFGSFGVVTTGVDKRLYPHNVLLEIWFEAGILPMLFLLGFIFWVLYDNLAKKNWPMFTISLYMILNALKSSSIADLRVMFALMCVILVQAASQRKLQQLNSTNNNN